jgi:hypothetical protein
VRDIKDPDGQGRVKVSLPWSPDANGATYGLGRGWRRVAGTIAEAVHPDVSDEVLVVFISGDPRRGGGRFLGTVGTRRRKNMDGAGQNYIKKLKSLNGVISARRSRRPGRWSSDPGRTKMTLRTGQDPSRSWTRTAAR